MNSPDTGTTLHLWHPCGQPVTAVEEMVGYSASFHCFVGERVARYCPRCGKRVRFAHLRPEKPAPCAETVNFFESAYRDEQDTFASLRATW